MSGDMEHKSRKGSEPADGSPSESLYLGQPAQSLREILDIQKLLKRFAIQQNQN